MEPNRLPHGIEQRLQARARRTGRSVTAVTRDAVLDSIEAIEDYYLALALVREQALRGTPGPARSEGAVAASARA
ncbi:hypothetical protein [Ramlibacter alkalitolerans]|jgi:predicted DNA-binding protein|uniref:Toxin-antitoxin system n=1 Tax=Ramlibacter alkalitolerans TaxID=2039631 RepID=A0ABS1JS15_9BURK|nr:hypothetical protein [Ramlibacter alkalitolerans]MBL0427042.1 hypothetical protein [Ramlibacter alkalitolerans]